ncbi:hypothetical protein AgCh_009582 [Apium graveolens]
MSDQETPHQKIVPPASVMIKGKKMIIRGKCDTIGKKGSQAWDYFDIVTDGLEEQHESIARVRNVVRYVRSSPSRLEKFRICVEKEKIKCDMTVQEAIVKLCSSDDMLMRDMANRMKDKYNKYWDNMDNTNFLLYVAVVLGPRYKMTYIEFCFDKIHGRGSTKSFMMCDKVKKTVQELFDQYKNLKGNGDSSSSSQPKQPDNTRDDDFEKYVEDCGHGEMGKSELDIYLADEREIKSEGMPISSVASEAPFSTSGRTIDAYRSSLSPKTTEALIYSQDWLSNSGNFIDLRGEPEEYLELKVVGTLMEKLDIKN